MRLKRLTLHGFKTFADRTEIEFVPGVTCIVGPNGSGKSNLLDALVWCLGEQKASNLRASRAQDVIFAGSSRRKPMGMAEVSLTVDNEDRFLPLDFAEVTITRRVYRNGEGEYLINRAPCRLRDITDLFLDTGVGRGAYAIVNQSEIDAILSARAEDRRELFEEAAGIKKYRVRKREAQRRLDGTESNLVRVRDILGELSEQVEPLREQAEVATRHRALSERLRQIEVGLLAADYRRLRDELGELGRTAEAAVAEENALQADGDDLERSGAGLGERIADAEARMEEARLRQQMALTQAERLESRIALADERRAGAERSLATLETDLESAREEGARLEKEADVLDAEAAAAQVSLEQAVRQLSEVETVAREADRALLEIARTVAGQEADYLALARRLSEQRAELAGLRERTARRAADIAEVRDRAARRADETRAAREDTARLAEAAAQARADAREARRVVSDEREPALREATAAVQRALDDRSSRERTLAAQESRLRALEETEAAQEGYFAGVRAVLGAASRQELPARYRLFADAIRVPARLETAIEVALGASLQDIVTDTERAAKDAIGWLNENRAGRATFLPLDTLRDQPVPDSLRMAPRRHDGVLGSAADLVECDAIDDRAVRVHLARVLVVEDLDTATKIARTIDRDWARIVTVGGELVLPTGAITGGRTGRQGPNLLSRKREIAELGEAVDTGRDGIEAATKTIDRCRDAEAQARLALREAETAALVARDAERDAERRVQARTLETDRLARDAEALAARATQLEEAGRDDAAREAALASAIDASDRTDEGAQATREESQRRQVALQSRKDDAREQASRLSAEAASLRERVAGLRRDAQRARLGAARAQAQEQERIRRADEARGVIALEEKETADRAAERDAAKAAVQDATAAVDRWRERRQALVAENFQLSERVKLVRRAIDAARERAQQARVKGARIEAQADAIGQRLQDEYDLHPDSAVALTGGDPVDRDTAQEIGRLRREIKGLGVVNAGAIEEYERVSERHRFLLEQKTDLEAARAQLLGAIAEIDASTRGVFVETFRQVGEAFSRFFARLFGGGSTELVMTDPDDVLETGIEILAQPPGKRRQSLALLSGGERALTATALLFAFLEVRPAPFCVLDEVDAPLDGANVEKFADLVRDFGARSQFILITHNATTMEAAPLWYGVTMQEPGVSRGLSMRVPDPAPEPTAV